MVSTEARLLATSRRDGMLMRPAVLAVVTAMALVIGGAGGWMSRQATLPAPPPPPAWDQLLARAPGLATPRSEERVKVIDEMMSELNQVGLKETDTAKRIRDDFANRKQVAEAARMQIDDVLNAIRAVRLSNPSAGETARRKIDEVESVLDPSIVAALREWAQDRRRPTEDRLDILATAIRNRLSERASSFADPSGPADERRLAEAKSLADTIEFLASLGEYANKLIGPADRERVRSFLDQNRTTEPKAQLVAAAIKKVIDSARILSAAAEALSQTPGDEKKFADVLESLRGFAQTQTEEDVRRALTLVADALSKARDATAGKSKP